MSAHSPKFHGTGPHRLSVCESVPDLHLFIYQLNDAIKSVINGKLGLK